MPTSNGLSLLALKIAPNVFDLSTGVVQVSLRDQVVRAQIFSEDLKQKLGAKKLLVVGAGLAGLTAAVRAAELGIEVVLVEKTKELMSLQRPVTSRYVGPFMYEWPSDGYSDQSYPKNRFGPPPKSTPTWTASGPIPASKFADEVANWMDSLLGSANPAMSNLTTCFGVNVDLIQRYVRKFSFAIKEKRSIPLFSIDDNLKDFSRNPIRIQNFQPDYIVLACGMGKERTLHKDWPSIGGKDFWDDDDFRETSAFSGSAGVFGGGDGALQDVLRLITKHDHPLSFIQNIEENGVTRESIQSKKMELLGLENQARLMSTWRAGDVYSHLDESCRAIAKGIAESKEVRKVVYEQLRPGSGEVHHFVREMSFGRTYLLNRFVLHLINECSAIGWPSGGEPKVRYIPHFDFTVRKSRAVSGKFLTNTKTPIVSVVWDGVNVRYELTHVSVRHGVEPPAQVLALSEQAKRDRISMSGLLLPVQLIS